MYRYYLFLLLFIVSFARVSAQGAIDVSPEEMVPVDPYPQQESTDLQDQQDLLKTERILNFHSDIVIDSTGKVQVTETIKVNVLGYSIKRGIYRALPQNRNLNDQRYKVEYQKIRVKRDGQKETFHTERGNGFFSIYVGSKKRILQPGVYTYEIRYTTKDQIGFFDDYDEFYWNVNGNEWEFPIDHISATVTLPKKAGIVQHACYTGTYGESAQNCTVELVNKNTLRWSAKGLRAGEGLTVAVGFDKGVIFPPPPPSLFQLYWLPFLLLLAFIWILRLFYGLWKKYGIDPPKPVVYPQFSPPEALSPASLGYLKHEGYREQFLTASIVHLAVKGYLKIEEEKVSKLAGLSKKTVFTLKKLKLPDKGLPDEEWILMNHLFSSSKTLKIDGSQDSSFRSVYLKYSKRLSDLHSPLIKKGRNLKHLKKPAKYIILIYLSALIINALLNWDFSFLISGVFILIFASIFTFFITYYVNRRNGGFGASKPKIGCASVFAVLFFLFFFVFFGSFFIIPFISNALSIQVRSILMFLSLSATTMILFAYLIKRPSEEKLRIQALIKGFEMYMGAAENERIKFENPPQFTPELFEKYLPYAIVLKVEKVWGQRFQDSLNTMESGEESYSAAWYSGTSGIAVGALASHLGSSLSNSFASASTAPSSSSSSGGSFSSGSGGGGFSGGGGGGGGGGGW